MYQTAYYSSLKNQITAIVKAHKKDIARKQQI